MVPKPRKYDRKGKEVTSGEGQRGPRLTEAKEGGSIKIGCTCRFYIKRYYFLPAIAEIVYPDPRHVNIDGLVVHDRSSEGHRFRFAKHHSPEIRKFVKNLYLAGVPIAKIHSMHMQTILRQRSEDTLVPTRDCFLSEDDIRNIVGVVNKDLYMKDRNDAESVRMWVRENPFLVFYYQESNERVEGALTGENMPFVVGIQTEFQFCMMLRHGHGSAVAIDATFGTNEKKVPPLAALHSDTDLPFSPLPPVRSSLY